MLILGLKGLIMTESKGYLAGDFFIAEINDWSFPLDTANK